MAEEKAKQKTDNECRRHDAGYDSLRRGESITSENRAADGTINIVGQDAQKVSRRRQCS